MKIITENACFADAALTMAEPKPEAVRLIIDNAAVFPPAPEPAAGDDDGAGKRRGSGRGGLPADCPVTPLGVAGNIYYYLDDLQQLRELAARDHSRLGVQSLFGTRAHLLYDYWPRMSKEGEVTGWRPERAAEELMKAAAAKHVWDVFQRVRGPGAWLGEDGELVLHCGDQVLAGTKWHRCGSIGAHVYPTGSPRPRPSVGLAQGGYAGPAQELLTMLGSWAWKRPETDAQLLLGWTMAGIAGGALKWRPAAWITGDRATGKSTLVDLLREVFDEGSGGVFALSDATPAGIWQHSKHASLPVILDELEPGDDNRRANAIIALARLAASGGVTVRGGADHSGHEFTIRSCFLFLSILLPPLLPQDRSRLAILELDPLAEGTKAPALDRRRMRALGAALRRRLVDHWGRLDATLDAYRGALVAAGHSGRGADQYGTLLALAEIALHDNPEIPADELALWGERLAAPALAERADDVSDHDSCLRHLLTAIVDPYRNGTRRTIAQWIGDALSGLDGEPGRANGVLETFGLRVTIEPQVRVRDEPEPRTRVYRLLIANTHGGLQQLYAGTHWAARSGASAPWVQALRRVRDAMPDQQRFAGVRLRCTALPLNEREWED